MTAKTPKTVRKSKLTKKAKLAALDEEYFGIVRKGLGLREDVEVGRVFRKYRVELKGRRELCAHVEGVLGCKMQTFSRLIARARAADLVPFNDMLNLPKTAIDALAAEKVPDGAIREAVKLWKQGKHITEAVGKEIADKHLEAAGRKRRKRKKKKPQAGQEVTLRNTPTELARHLATFTPENIRRIADSAASQARPNRVTASNSVPLLEAIRWVAPALPNEAAIRAGIATDYVLFKDGYISAYSGSLLARAPCAQDGTFMVCGRTLLGWCELEKWRDEEPRLRHKDDRVRFEIPGDDSVAELTPRPIHEFCRKDTDLGDRNPDGEHHQLPKVFTTALASLRRLASPKPGIGVANYVWLYDGAAIVVNLPMIACVRNVGVRTNAPLGVTDEVLRFMMKNPSVPSELFIEPDMFWLRWADSFHIGVARETSPEGAQYVLGEALARLDASVEPAVKVTYQRPTTFERANGLTAMSVLVQPNRLIAKVGMAHHGDTTSTEPPGRKSRAGDRVDFSVYSSFLPFQHGDIIGLVGLSTAVEREDDEAAD